MTEKKGIGVLEMIVGLMSVVIGLFATAFLQTLLNIPGGTLSILMFLAATTVIFTLGKKIFKL